MVRISKLFALMLVSVLLLGGCARSGSGSEPTDEYADKIEAAGVNVYPRYDLPGSLEELIEKNSPDIAATMKVVSRGESYKMATSYEIELGEVYLGDAVSGDKLTLVTDYSIYDGETYRTSGSTVFRVGSEYLVFLKGCSMDELVPEAGNSERVYFVCPPPRGVIKISGEYTPTGLFEPFKTLSELKKGVSELCKN